MSSIRVSEKHGVNPSMSLCFWCGEHKNEIIMLGRLPGDKETPPAVIINYDPCDKCKEKMKQGITVVQASTSPMNPNQAEIQKGVYPTGKWVVLNEETVEKIFIGETKEEVLKKKRCFVDRETWKHIRLPE